MSALEQGAIAAVDAPPDAEPVSRHYLEHRALLGRVTGARRLSPGERVARLKDAVSHALEKSPFYRTAPHWRAVDELDPLSMMPFTTRQDLQQAYPLGMLAAPPGELVRYAESTGTTGPRCAGYVTRDDWLTNNLSVAMSWATLLSKEDTLAVAVPYELTYVGADIDRVAELLGAAVISVGTNNTLCPWPRALELMRSHGVTALFCAPTRAIRLAQLARERGLDPRKDLQVRKIICVGEHCSDARREYLARAWDARVYNHYGMTEALAVAVPCGRQALHLCEDRLYAELIDPDSGAPVHPGEPGELVLTTLAHRAMPLLRYRTGDLLREMSTKCPCGNPFRVVKQLGRVTDTFQTRMGTAYFHQLDEALLSEPDIQPYFSVAWEEDGLRVRVVLSQAVREGRGRARAEVVASLEQRLGARFGVGVTLVVEDEARWLDRIDNSSKPGSALQSRSGPSATSRSNP
ncbi:AMP-binding protein [Myxococcus stipitatus]|uniref:phenylacetate--CoA ligase family protein n=1 Tax=Myxococcus stipitatus TaxID=83455 RepID=UPI001F1AC42F|nr:AMP-binding protein [Myxococcus stipitatus]MCE9669676.1 AMP-binding protein [Myxococcus stipitatus]